ncbi:TetR/AcrR family transcriptional regulator [Pedobacter gandavensis]|uniref:TetR family transcriptional regulator n=1 Tax=Pedobacter gandavensis TaxID=2679963 RepID=A0ABR6EXX2_9SPHI|nr:TetR/AcrR family transcriptional regulator [Pedobacter gandavensis]MBB2149278.1 TetR family transcriptional regulator [Pedobacter gandavensis]
MENPYKRKKDPEASKQLILNTAAEIGATADWHQVTFQAIADKTGLSKGGIIHHFRNKEELLEELVRQSLVELTDWIVEEKKSLGNDIAPIAFLRFVIKKSTDLSYRRTMKVILQAALVNEQYKKMWHEWFTEHIAGGSIENMDINSQIIMLVADGFWFADNLNLYNISESNKEQIVNKLLQLN